MCITSTETGRNETENYHNHRISPAYNSEDLSIELQTGMKIEILIMGILIFAGVNKTLAQVDSYDIYTFTPDSKWKRSDFNDNIQFTLQKGNNWAVVGLYKSTATTGSIDSDFQADWNDLVGNNYVVTSDVSREENSFKGWQMMTGSAKGSRQNQNVNISMLTFSCPAGRSTILLATNDFSNTLESDITAFMGSVSVIPAESATPVAGHHQPAAMDNYQPPMMPAAGSSGTSPTPGEQTVTRATTSDGWLVEATNDYIQYSSPGIKVVQYFYVAPEDPNSNTDDEDLFWRKFLANYYSADSYIKFPNEPYAFMNRIESASGYAISKTDGKQYFLVWIVALGMKCSFLAITNDISTYKKYFSHPNDLITLERYNYFTASTDDLQGSWVNSGFSGAMLYNSYSGMAAGMTYASVSEEWTFSGKTTRYFSSGATGTGVSINTFTQEESGTFQLSGNDLTVQVAKPATKTHEFWCGFVAGKGGLLLKLANKKFTSQVDYFSRKR
jgi:hypothetical protein